MSSSRYVDFSSSIRNQPCLKLLKAMSSSIASVKRRYHLSFFSAQPGCRLEGRTCLRATAGPASCRSARAWLLPPGPSRSESTRDNLLQAHLVGRFHDNPILTPFRRSSIENGTFAVPISTVNLPSLFSVTGAVNVYRQDARSEPGIPWCTASRVRWPTDKCPTPTAVPLRLMVTGIPCRMVVAA
jgi:hypothetical protein